MRITRIKRATGYRVFQDFCWPNDLHDFGQFNLIYGWNGAGKTTLSTVFRHLQDREPIQGGDVELQIDARTISGTDFKSASLPAVRVFNRDVAIRSVFESSGELEPIYFLGVDSVETQKRIENVSEEIRSKSAALAEAESAAERSRKALDEFCIQRARLIKEVLLSSRAPAYANYDKKRFKTAVTKLNDVSVSLAMLPPEEQTHLRTQKDAQPKDPVAELQFRALDLPALTSAAELLLRRRIISSVIKELADDPEVAAWVQRGLLLHSGSRETKTCRFCATSLSKSRLTDLEAHFNDALSQLQSEIGTLAADVESEDLRLAALQAPEPATLYEDLRDDLRSAGESLRGHTATVRQFLQSLRRTLVKKQQSPFEEMALDTSAKADGAAIMRSLAAINSIIKRHNDRTTDFQNSVKDACARLEASYAADAYSEYRRLSSQVDQAEARCRETEIGIDALNVSLATLEREALEYRRPADELSADLAAYLGRDELRLQARKTGYRVLRAGQPAMHLSEGEKTAIAFLYFLKSLSDRSFDLANGIVVIDDPVSSLDANALYSAFGYMKERTKTSGQLFILTHSFHLFRQVRNWFHYLPGQNKKDVAARPARFFMLSTVHADGRRTARLGPLDPLLEEHESEYHYLFKRVREEAGKNQDGELLERCYDIPNLARRLLEAFLSFRFPDVDSLHTKMDQVDFDAARKTRVLRFLHTYSHHDSVAPPAHDLSILSETRAVLRDVLDLMRHADPGHFDRMLEATTDR